MLQFVLAQADLLLLLSQYFKQVPLLENFHLIATIMKVESGSLLVSELYELDLDFEELYFMLRNKFAWRLVFFFFGYSLDLEDL